MSIGLTAPAPASRVQRLLLAAGVPCALVYIGLDLVAASRYPHYSLRDQAISELSAIGAPTARLWSIVGWFFAAFLVAFAAGLVRTKGSRALRTVGWLMLALAALGPLWARFPMHQRGTVAVSDDAGHLVLGAVSMVLIAAFMAAGAIAIGGWFRHLSVVMLVVVLATFLWTFTFPLRAAADAQTPWMGVIERVAIYGYLIWIGLLSLVLAPSGAGRFRA